MGADTATLALRVLDLEGKVIYSHRLETASDLSYLPNTGLAAARMDVRAFNVACGRLRGSKVRCRFACM